MSKKWHSGPPPSVGWWIASLIKNERSLRWWDGTRWSVSALQDETAEDAAVWAICKAGNEKQPLIKWQHRPASWPERSKT